MPKFPVGWNSHIDEITVLDFSVLHQLGVSINIVNHLRDQTANVDGVCGGKLEALYSQLCSKFSVAKDLLHTGLGIIKVAVNGDNRGVPGTSAKPAIAALPVSPEVAVRITISFST